MSRSNHRTVRNLTPAAILFLATTMNTMTLAQATTQPSDQVPVRAVTLFSSGVGYFEHFGTIHDSASTNLNFKTAQINDILKSLVLQDLDGGSIAAVNYASQEPLDRKLKSFGVDVSGQPSLADLLAQLRGAKVTLVAADRTTTGTILGVEKKQIGQAQSVVERSVISVFTGGGIKTETLEDVREIKLEDPKLQDELTKALEALAGARDQDKKTVTLKFSGTGDRRVRVGYVVETPIWKTSYRLLLNDGAKGGGGIQGWAIVENQTDADWTNVQLSLVSGRPISFIQDLYTPLFVPRPTVTPELYASLRPQQYEGGITRPGLEPEMTFGGAPAAPMLKAARSSAAPAPAAAPGARFFAERRLDANDSVLLPKDENGPMDAAASIQSVASAEKIGELFQYTVGSVSLPRQTSAMIPIVTDPLEVEKVSIYNQSVLQKNPLNGARVKNTTGKHLLAGPITVLDGGTYAGDARIDNLPPGQERLLSYGIDLQMTVDAAKNQTTSTTQSATVSKGVLYLKRKVDFIQTYELANKADTDKTVIVEHPRRGGEWKLVDSPDPIEKTDALYRFKDKIPAGKTSKLTVKEESTQIEGIALLNFSVDDFLRYASTSNIPSKVKDALTKAADLKRQLEQTARDLQANQARVNEMTQDQTRLRENLKTVQQTSDYAQRLLKKLNDQESGLEQLQSKLEDLRTTQSAQQKALSDYLATLDIQ